MMCKIYKNDIYDDIFPIKYTSVKCSQADNAHKSVDRSHPE